MTGLTARKVDAATVGSAEQPVCTYMSVEGAGTVTIENRDATTEVLTLTPGVMYAFSPYKITAATVTKVLLWS